MKKISLTDFTMSYDGYPDCKVGIPCSLLDTLYKNNFIEDPYYMDNAAKLMNLPEHECFFRTEFTVDGEFISREKKLLVCRGLDTLCSVRVNGKEIGYADNMHRTWKFDLSGVLHEGKNFLEFCFFPPLKYMKDRQHRHYAWGDTHAMDGIAHIRKASYMFGWDWAPKLPDAGIFRSVELEGYDLPELENVLVLQEHKRGEVTLVVTAETEGEVPDGVSYRAEIISPLGERVSVLSDDAHFRIQIKDPLLWWPNGYGEQPLYSLRVSMVRAETELSSVEKTIGLRTITVSRERDEWGREFCFEVNGKKIFAMGADYIPEDNILPRITAQRSEKLIQSCARANFNCLRIWGGGFYPSDEFYELCDRYGIILWQDFMFACLNVWLNSDFEENVVNEIRDVLLRIRHHACIGLICGNNEMEMAFCEWKIPKDELVKSDYLRLYERIMPDMCEKYAPQIFYWPSSPSCGGGFDDPNSADDGDAHYWEVWLRNAPMESYNDYYFRFCSEFGFESFPDRKTVRYYTGGMGENPLSDVIEFHQKREQASVKLVTYAADNFLYASDFDNFVYTTQIVQGEAIQYAVEHMRRFRGRCMGAVYWQLNDSWPGQTWSSVDYFGRWKALHYFARRFFERQTVFAHKYGDKTVFVASNETLGRFEGRCRIRVKNNAFEVLGEENIDFSLSPLSSEDIKIFDTAEVMQGLENQRFFEYTVFDRADRELFNGAFVCIKNKFYHYDCPHISYSLEKDSDTYVLRLCARAFARYVEISSDKYDLISEDNYFDITDNGVRSVKISAPGVTDASDLENSLKIRCVYDIDK